MKVLITGAYGCVGGRLAQHLAARGSSILLGTRHPGDSPEWLPGATVVHTDWLSIERLGEVCAGVDAIVHLAGMNAQDSAADPEAALEVNKAATERLFDAASRNGVDRLIYFSTAHVYSSPLSGRITEDTLPTNEHPYAASHLAGEKAVLAGGNGADTAGIVARLSNSYGAPAHKNANCWMLLVNDLCRQAATENELVLRTSGTQRRDFIPLADVCRAVEHLLRLPRGKVAGQVFNVGGNWAPTVWEMAGIIQQRCEKTLGRTPKLSRIEPAPGDVEGELDYGIDALLATGFALEADRVGEIDRLLKFCEGEFG